MNRFQTLLATAWLAGSSWCAGDLVFGARVAGPGGTVGGLFQMRGGVVTPIPTGLPDHAYLSLSRDGRLIAISSPDPARPDQAATDLFLYDRATGMRRTLVDYSVQPQPDGSFVTPLAQFSAISPNQQLVALTTMLQVSTNLQGTSFTPMVTLHRMSDGFQVGLAEMGQGAALDFFRAEFVGISWTPDGRFFATPAYVPTTSVLGNAVASVGIAVFGFDPVSGQWARAGQITSPRVFDDRVPNVIETHIFPEFSPNGQRLAYFEVTWPDALLQGPASVRLMAVNADGSSPLVLVNFQPGFYPLGLSWTADGSEVVYSIAPQVQVPGAGFAPFGVPEGAAVRAVNATNPVAILQVPGVDSGYLPSQAFLPGGGGGGGGDLGNAAAMLARQEDGSLLLRAEGLDPVATYLLERSDDLLDFGEGVPFSGQQLMNGVRIEATAGAGEFFRIAPAP